MALKSLKGAVALITGGSSGIGLGLARACAGAGMKVAITYQTEAHCQEARDFLGQQSQAYRLDVRDREGFARVAKETEETLGPIALLALNAGIALGSTILESTDDDWERALDINLMGVVNGIKTVVPRMLDHGRPAHVLAVSSMSGLMVGGRTGVYSTVKFAVVGLMESLRVELDPRGIGVSVVCPGVVRSRIASRAGYDTPLDHAMDPLACGTAILGGVRDNALFILTHPEFGPGLKQRSKALLLSLPEAETIPNERLQLQKNLLSSPIYDNEVRRLSPEGKEFPI